MADLVFGGCNLASATPGYAEAPAGGTATSPA